MTIKGSSDRPEDAKGQAEVLRRYDAKLTTVIQSEESCDSRLANRVLCCCRVLRWRDAEPGGGATTEEGGGDRRRRSFSQDASLPPAGEETRREEVRRQGGKERR